MELGSGVVGREGPRDGPLLGVPLRLQRPNLPLQRRLVPGSSPEAFSADDCDLDLSEPKLLHLL
jgi:hypothetical protein